MSTQIDKTGNKKNDEGKPSIEPGERQPIVNSEEQNKPINPADSPYHAPTDSVETKVDNTNNSPGKNRVDGASAIDKPDRIEGGDDNSNERSIPKL